MRENTSGSGELHGPELAGSVSEMSLILVDLLSPYFVFVVISRQQTNETKTGMQIFV